MTDLDSTLGASPVMAILRSQGVARSVRLATTAWDLGIDSVEVTLQSPSDVDALREVARLAAERGKTVCAGTIVSVDQIPVAQAAGASYLVSPGLDADIVRAAEAAGIPAVPGVATPSDVQRATALGLTWLKAFPATWLGADWFRHIRGPFPDVRFVATGGVDASNAQSFLDAGVRVVAVGSALEDESQLEKLAGLIGARA